MAFALAVGLIGSLSLVATDEEWPALEEGLVAAATPAYYPQLLEDARAIWSARRQRATPYLRATFENDLRELTDFVQSSTWDELATRDMIRVEETGFEVTREQARAAAATTANMNALATLLLERAEEHGWGKLEEQIGYSKKKLKKRVKTLDLTMSELRMLLFCLELLISYDVVTVEGMKKMDYENQVDEVLPLLAFTGFPPARRAEVSARLETLYERSTGEVEIFDHHAGVKFVARAEEGVLTEMLAEKISPYGTPEERVQQFNAAAQERLEELAAQRPSLSTATAA